jgi:hypothetical protein
LQTAWAMARPCYFLTLCMVECWSGRICLSDRSLTFHRRRNTIFAVWRWLFCPHDILTYMPTKASGYVSCEGAEISG